MSSSLNPAGVKRTSFLVPRVKGLPEDPAAMREIAELQQSLSGPVGAVSSMAGQGGPSGLLPFMSKDLVESSYPDQFPFNHILPGFNMFDIAVLSGEEQHLYLFEKLNMNGLAIPRSVQDMLQGYVRARAEVEEVFTHVDAKAFLGTLAQSKPDPYSRSMKGPIIEAQTRYSLRQLYDEESDGTLWDIEGIDTGYLHLLKSMCLIHHLPVPPVLNSKLFGLSSCRPSFNGFEASKGSSHAKLSPDAHSRDIDGASGGIDAGWVMGPEGLLTADVLRDVKGKVSQRGLDLGVEVARITAQYQKLGKQCASPVLDLLRARASSGESWVLDSELLCLSSIYTEVGMALPGPIAWLLRQREVEVLASDQEQEFNDIKRMVRGSLRTVELDAAEFDAEMAVVFREHRTIGKPVPDVLIALVNRRMAHGGFWVEDSELDYLVMHYQVFKRPIPSVFCLVLKQREENWGGNVTGPTEELDFPLGFEPFKLKDTCEGTEAQLQMLAFKYRSCGLELPESLVQKLAKFKTPLVACVTPLMQAASQGDLEACRRLLKKRGRGRVDVMVQDSSRRTAWHCLQLYMRDVLHANGVGVASKKMAEYKELAKMIYPGDKLRGGFDLGDWA